MGFTFAAPPAAGPPRRKALYGSTLSKLRQLMICRMAKPEEVRGGILFIWLRSWWWSAHGMVVFVFCAANCSSPATACFITSMLATGCLLSRISPARMPCPTRRFMDVFKQTNNPCMSLIRIPLCPPSPIHTRAT